MAKASFDQALALVLSSEGGYVNDPQDPGGATNKGVTQAVYDAWRTSQGQPAQSVASITTAELTAIYQQQYWDQVHGDDLPAGLDYAAFDYAVNSGAGRASADLQRTVGVPADGKLGVVTLNAINAAPDVSALISGLCDRRMAFLKTLKTWGRFGKGWQNRVWGVEHDATAMAGLVKARPSEVAAAQTVNAENASAGASQKASPADVSVTKTSGTAMATHTVAGVVGSAAAAAAAYGPQVVDSASKARDYIAPHVHYLPILEKGLGALTGVIIGGAAVGWLARWWQTKHGASK